MTETQSLLDQIANAKRERDAAAVDWCEWYSSWKGANGPIGQKYHSARAKLAALESQLTEQGKDAK